MKRIETTLREVILIEPDVIEDARGFFFESYNANKFAELGISREWVQDNHSRSVRGTLRGLHYQVRHPQAKLCRVVQGEVLDVVVDIRYGSPTFGKFETAILSAQNRREIYMPEGFAHGFLVLSETAEFLYKCSDYYFPELERGIAWDDPALRIPWGVNAPVLSVRDTRHPALSEVQISDLPTYEPGLQFC